MRSFAVLAVSSLAFLVAAANGSARPQTTAPGGYLTVRVVVTNKGVTMTPARARRGQTAIFILSNRSSSARVFSLGDHTLTRSRGTGFAVKLGRNQQKRILLYLDYRGPLPSSIGAAGAKTKVVGVFFVT